MAVKKVTKKKAPVKKRKNGPAKGEGGRPYTYKNSYCKIALEYFNEPMMVKKVRQQATGSGKVVDVEYEVPRMFPSMAGLARRLKCSKDTVYRWAKENPDFSDALNECRAIQEELLTAMSLGGDWHAGFAKFLMINNHGYKDKVEQEVTTKDITVQIDNDDAEL